MFAVVQVGSHQFKISEGDVIAAQLQEGNAGDSVTLEQVLLISNGPDVHIGRPFLKGASITAEIVNQFLDEKKISYKYRRRKNYSWKKGHRQKLTSLSIKKINTQ